MVSTDGQKASKFALATSIWCKADGVIPGDLSEPLFEVANHFEVSSSIRGITERVHVGKTRPSDWFHLCGRVQLHRARPERNHGSV